MQSLERKLGLMSVTTIGISSMIGPGIFVLPGIGIAATGPSLFIAFALSALIVLPAAMGKAELATAMPTSGGTYVYIERTFGPLCGTVAGLGLFLSILFKSAFALIGLGAYFNVLSSFPLYPTILSFLAIITTLNILGVSKVSSFLSFFLLLTLAGLLVTIGLSIPLWDASHFSQLLPHGYSGLADATALVFVAYAGVTKVAAIAGEVKAPQKNLPRGILLSLAIVAVLYCGVSFTLSGVFSSVAMAGEIRPIYHLAQHTGYRYLGLIMAAIAVITMVNTSNAGLLAASRFPFAMSKDRLLPAWFSQLSHGFLTPIASILLSGAIIALVALTMDVVRIAKLASAFMIMIYLVENICVIILREARPQWYKPGYQAPWYPFLQLFGIISTAILLYFMGQTALVAITAIAIPGTIFYFIYAAKRTTRKGVVGIKSRRSDLIEEQPRHRLDDFLNTQRSAQVVVGLFGKEKSADILVEIGLALAAESPLEVASLIEVPEQITLQDIVSEPQEIRSLRRRVQAMAQARRPVGTSGHLGQIHFDSIVTHDLAKAIYQISQCVHCKWLLTEWRGRSRGALTIHRPIGWLKSHLHCHLAIYRDAGVRYIKSLLVMVDGDNNDQIVLETAHHLADIYDAKITLVKWLNQELAHEQAVGQAQRLQTMATELSSQLRVKVEARLIEGKNQVASIVNETVEHDLLIIGGRDHSLINSLWGAVDDRIIEQAACSVMAVHAASH